MSWFIPIVLKTIITNVIVSSNLTLSVFIEKMSQKINATGLRLKKKLSWNSVFCLHNPQKYANLTVSNRQIKYATTAILSKINTYSNRLFTVRNSKTAVVYSKLIQQQQAYKNTRFYQKQMLKRMEAALSALSSLRNLSLTGNFINYQLSRLITQNSVIKKKGLDRSSHFLKSSFTLLTAKLITSFVSALLQKDAKTKYGIDTSNLSASIPLLLTKLLSPFKNQLLGVKVICSGRWKKTGSGRKQKLCVKYGRVRNPNLSSVILFDYITQKTKFGACGIKVWVANKKPLLQN